MATPEEDVPVDDQEQDEEGRAYMVPEKVSVTDILNKDADDESLIKYKKTLLGGDEVRQVPYPDDKRNVILEELVLVLEDKTEVGKLDLKASKEDLKNCTLMLKEKDKFKVNLKFAVQREIVSGLRYVQGTYKGPMKVDKMDFMVGSYGPRKELYCYSSPTEDAPSGVMSRGTFKIKSLFTDDDKNEILKWEWNLKIAALK